MKELPAGWTTTTLGSLCLEMRNGISAKPDLNEGLPILRISAVRPMKLDKSDTRFLPLNFNGAATYKLREDDLLFTRYNGNRELVGACARVGKLTSDLVYPDKLIRVRLRKELVCPAFVERAANTAAARGFISEKLKTSAGQVGVSGADLKLVPLRIAPLAEQKRIAYKLDSVLARVSACRDHLDRVPAILKRFRQSVLTAACTGGLTDEWRIRNSENVNASQLAQLILLAHESSGGHKAGNAAAPTEDVHDLTCDLFPAAWGLVTLRDIVRPDRPITYGILKPGPEVEEGVPYVRVADFPGEKLNLSTIRKTSPQMDREFKRSRLSTGDLLLSIRGTVGRLVVVPQALERANITQDTARLSLQAAVNRDFVLWYLRSEMAQSRMKGATKGVAVRGINIGDVRALQIPLPSQKEQDEIVRRIESLFAWADRLETRHAAARAQVDRLTPSLLAKAFRGELVPQDSADEPASELLKRLTRQAPAHPAASPKRQGATPTRAKASRAASNVREESSS